MGEQRQEWKAALFCLQLCKKGYCKKSRMDWTSSFVKYLYLVTSSIRNTWWFFFVIINIKKHQNFGVFYLLSFGLTGFRKKSCAWTRFRWFCLLTNSTETWAQKKESAGNMSFGSITYSCPRNKHSFAISKSRIKTANFYKQTLKMLCRRNDVTL